MKENTESSPSQGTTVKFQIPYNAPWPTKQEDYPFWSWLQQLNFNKVEKKKDGKKIVETDVDHVNVTIEAAEKLIGDSSSYHDYFKNLKNAAADLTRSIHIIFGYGGAIRENGLFGSPEEGIKAKKLLPILGFYHDIGKAIARPGHPSLGYRILHDMEPEEREKLENFLRDTTIQINSESFFKIIRYHDVFGVICTGEASLPMFADIYSAVADPQESRKILGLLVLLNIADLHATLLPDGLTEERVQMMLHDWDEIDAILQDPQIHTRADFTEALQRKVSQPEAAINRIARLFVAALMRANKGKVLVRLHESPIEEHIKTFFGNRLDDFARRFAHFCKFDYGLNFFRDIIDCSGIKSAESRENFAFTSAEIRSAIVPMLKVISRIVQDYYGLEREAGSRDRNLIVNMSINPGVSKKLAELLALRDRDVEALSWLVDEIGVSVIS